MFVNHRQGRDILSKLDFIVLQQEQIMSVIDDIKADVAALKTLADAAVATISKVGSLTDQVTSLQATIAQSPVTPADLDAVKAGLDAIKAELAGALPAPAAPAAAPAAPGA